ncbi:MULTISPECIES: DUF2790 domain-containing protein [Pseudomonas syringae group]|uniref:DUF2790 domain-containing protein n=3 Tax=Pseudomonas syringae group TaxID=136849 RepID=A0AAE6UKU3_9PSED|nr:MULTISPECIES: DUF2790 domain-containing protein [Pseudomonas syringae group]KGS14026.1 topoisomerase II [Pseudomonas coronafaciens]KPW33563.1 Uncharacterized protein ALO66_00632 [Pseudomonas coronafaciens pv. atropurpurea]KPX33611.1 Uncharacterized protein ALO77_00859 [Pseudomonas coronafaciens pv. garcae]KPY03484.1 Uncharacterized protein ALO57_00474 [Pseudomonas coronafaciens pv. oryzae]KPZ21070.1 Uncharacterized protein ALO38_01158 [Pseudomonas coronafaciens pv. zizaniae]
MKASLMVLALCSISSLAMAEESQAKVAAQQARVEQYTYGTHLDIAKVISISQTPNVCEVVPARMVYEDSQGTRHVMGYQVMGNGCSNG